MNGPSQPGDGAPVDAIGRTAQALLVAAMVLLALPTLLAGTLVAFGLRAFGLRWTWTPLLGVVLCAPLAVAFVDHTDDVLALARELAAIDPPRVATIGAVLWPWWLAAVAPVAIALRLWLDRRDRLHGGFAERRVAAALGPVRLLGRARRRWSARRAPDSSEGTVLGRTRGGEPVRVATLRAHGMIVGGSGSGKTTTASVLLGGEVAAGRGFVILDGKGGRSLPETAVELGCRYRRPVALWSILPYGDSVLDRRRWRWNPVGGGNATEVKDRIASAEEQTEPYYAAIASRGLLCAAQAGLLAADRDGGEPLRLDRLAALLEQPGRLAAALRAVDADRFARDIGWLGGLTETERSGLRGMGTRLSTMVASDGGEWLLPDPDGREIDLHQAICDGWLIVFTLPQGTYPALIPHVCRYAIATLNAAATRVERAGIKARALVFVDELSAFDGDQLTAGLERGRSAGLSYLLATQSLSNFTSAGGPKLLDAVLDNSELFVIHRQKSGEATEQLAGLAGTEEAWEHTHKVSDHGALRIFGDESGDRARRLTGRFRAHPNQIKQLNTGEAILITHRPNFRVAEIKVQPPG